MYISLDTDKDCELLLYRPVLSTGRKPHEKTVTVLLQPKSDHEFQKGSMPRRTDRLTVYCKVTWNFTPFTSP
jgi:hypothetical protein